MANEQYPIKMKLLTAQKHCHNLNKNKDYVSQVGTRVKVVMDWTKFFHNQFPNCSMFLLEIVIQSLSSFQTES